LTTTMGEHKDSKKRAGEKPKYLPFRREKKKLNGKVPDIKRDSKEHRYIVAEYNDKMKGKVIPDNQVVRANNGRWFTQNEIENFELKSTPFCPTYGVCGYCFSSGPVHMHCQKCKVQGSRYFITRMNGKILDTEWISQFFGTSHIDERADKMHNWITQRIWNMSPGAVVAYIKMMWLAREPLRDVYK
jgi:hypothetical protein